MSIKTNRKFCRLLMVYSVTSCLCFSIAASAHDYTGLTIDGSYQPSDVGTFPVTANYSWLWYEFVGGARVSWFYGPGTDGGVIFNKAQGHPPYDVNGTGTYYNEPSELAGNFLFLNEKSVLYSTANGIQIDAQNNIDMRNLRLFRGPIESDIGVGVNASSVVPLVSDITALADDESGWQVYADNSYDLVFYTTWQANPMGIHFHGQVIPASPPQTSGFWPANASAGAFIFVFGSDFEANNTQVSINGISAPIAQVVTSDMLIFQLPAGDTAGPVSITTPHGSIDTASSFGQSLSGLNLSGIWPGNGVRAGDFVFVFGSGFSYPLNVSIGAVTIPVVQVVTDGMLIFLMPQDANTGTISITVNSQTVTTELAYPVRP